MSTTPTTEEAHLIATIRAIMRNAELEAKPFVDRLAEIRATKSRLEGNVAAPAKAW